MFETLSILDLRFKDYLVLSSMLHATVNEEIAKFAASRKVGGCHFVRNWSTSDWKLLVVGLSVWLPLGPLRGNHKLVEVTAETEAEGVGYPLLTRMLEQMMPSHLPSCRCHWCGFCWSSWWVLGVASIASVFCF